MSVVLESRMLRDFLHRLVDNLLDDFESKATSPTRPAVISPTPRAGIAKPSITLEPTGKKAASAKPEPRPPWKASEVTVSCRRDCGRLAISVVLSAEVAQRVRLKFHGKAAAELQAGKLRVRASKKGAAVYRVSGASGRVFFHVAAQTVGVTEGHRAESCTFHYDLQDALLIEPPAWLKKAAVLPSRPQVRSKKKNDKAKDAPSVSCKKMRGTNPAIKCAACQKATATVECSRCPTLLCDGCWDPHVRTHWHTAVTSKPPVGKVANLKE